MQLREAGWLEAMSLDVLVFLGVTIALSPSMGCSHNELVGASLQTAKIVTLGQLEDSTKHLEQIEYLGVSAGPESHFYFWAEGLGYYRVPANGVWTSLPPLKGPWEAGTSKLPVYVRLVKGKAILAERH
jgi:hypothetical protein